MQANVCFRLLRGLAPAAALLGCAPAFAQPSTSPLAPDRHIEIPVTTAEFHRLHVTSLGRILQDGPDGYGQRECRQIATHTDANFNGGSYRAQAGFAETEMFAQTYTLPASAFPIRIDMGEAIFVTSNSSMNTVTQWSIQFWEGNPQTGTLVASESSDDVVLPYLRMGPGTNGFNIQFSVDPGDPEQIIINDNGSHQFSMGWRIDHHNQQTANPCLSAPPTCCNAFPCTDVSGLAHPTDNWLYGVNCGSFGCPPNGGWVRFSNLSQLCRPTGDAVMRATWSSVSCVAGVGACCLPDGTCSQATQQQCSDAGGTWRGEFTDCASANCPVPTGACCFSNGFCTSLTRAQCQGAQGTYSGDGVACGAGSVCPTGACCLPDGSCVTGLTQNACNARGGSFGGIGSSCATSCPTGACCLPIGDCITATQVQCAARGGTWRGAGTSCTGANCPLPEGACCLPNGFCLSATEPTCAGIPGGTWKGAFTTCVDGNNNGLADVCEARCIGDFNGDGGVDGGDVEAFYLEWQTGANDADVNEDGGVDGGDVETFFIHWEAGGC